MARGGVMAKGGAALLLLLLVFLLPTLAECGKTGFLPSRIGGWRPGYQGAGPVWVPSGYVRQHGGRSSGSHRGGSGGGDKYDSGYGQQRGGRSSGSCGTTEGGEEADEKMSMIIQKHRARHSGISGIGRKGCKNTKKGNKHTTNAAVEEGKSDCRSEATPLCPARQQVTVNIGYRAGTAVEVVLDMSDTMRLARDLFYQISHGEAAPEDAGHYFLCEGRELKLSSTVWEGGVKESANLFLMEFAPARHSF